VVEQLEKRRDELRAALLVLAAGHPNRQVQKLAERLAVEVFNALHTATMFVRDPLQPSGTGAREHAVADHRQAVATAQELLTVIRGGRRSERHKGRPGPGDTG
jgi:uncharacterized protein YaaN involved in tellurite resistance